MLSLQSSTSHLVFLLILSFLWPRSLDCALFYFIYFRWHFDRCTSFLPCRYVSLPHFRNWVVWRLYLFFLHGSPYDWNAFFFLVFTQFLSNNMVYYKSESTKGWWIHDYTPMKQHWQLSLVFWTCNDCENTSAYFVFTFCPKRTGSTARWYTVWDNR